MKNYFILFFIFLSPLAISQVNVENDSVIIWSKNQKITLNDFLSDKKNNVHKYKNRDETDVDAVAVISISLYPKKINCEIIHDIKVIVKMHKELSWKKNKTENDKGEQIQILNHEQTHFNIGEVYARKIRKAIEEFVKESEACDLQGVANIYYHFEEEHWQTQFLYDEETKHSIDYEKQWEWDEKINKLLEKYKDYELIIDIDDLELE